MSAIPGGFNLIQQESVQYNRPVSEAALSAIGSSINGLLSIVLPVGSIIESMLTEIQFQNQTGNPNPAVWVLADGRSAAGTGYNAATGQANIPDLRGIFVRGKNNGRSDGNQNPDGDLALGTYSADKFLSHTHSSRVPGGSGSSGQPGPQGLEFEATTATGGNETAPKNVTVNTFIRIN